MFGSKKEMSEGVSIDTPIKPITLEYVKEQQDKIIEMISNDKFQERLCAMIQEEIRSAVMKQSEIAQRRINSKMEANLANQQFLIVNKVITEITNHIDKRIEKRIKDLEDQIDNLENKVK